MSCQTNILSSPAGRSGVKELHNEQGIIENAGCVTALMDAMPDLAMILNEHRQIVAVNRRFLLAFGIDGVEAFIGKRPGEAFGCIHFGDGPDGCGSAPNCSVCGAFMSIVACQKSGVQADGECLLSLEKNGGSSLDLEATATPLGIEDKMFTIFVLKDISAEKRKLVIERIFFHDIINTAGGIRGLAEMLSEPDLLSKETEDEYRGWMLTLSDNLIDEIMHHRRLLDAERGVYEPVLDRTDLVPLLGEVCRLYEHHEKAAGRTIHLRTAGPCLITTDRTALRRIVGNMVLNALEASGTGSVVQVGYTHAAGNVRIEVANPGEIKTDVQLKIFKRSFSTKGSSGRGIGTYSMKLFGERYLGGRVDFTSRDGVTTFFIDLPFSTAGKPDVS